MINKILNEIKYLKSIYSNMNHTVSIDFNLNEAEVFAYFYPNLNKISFNLNIAKEIGFERFKEVIIHEFAHYINYKIYKNLKHNALWKKEMLKLGINNARATIERNINRIGLFKVNCTCSEYMITKNRLTRLKNGRAYKCKKCGNKIKET